MTNNSETRKDWIKKCKWGMAIPKDIIEKFELTKDFSFKNYSDKLDNLFVTTETNQLNTKAEMDEFITKSLSNLKIRWT